MLTPAPALQLQKSKEREEQLDEMIQAYEKLCVEKADLESELGEMVGACGWQGHWQGRGHWGPLPHAGQIASPPASCGGLSAAVSGTAGTRRGCGDAGPGAGGSGCQAPGVQEAWGQD